MNTLSLDIRHSDLEQYKVVNILIDNMPLAGMLYLYEKEPATYLQIPDLAGCYEGLPSVIVLEATQHFWGEALTEYCYDGERIALMDYAHSGIPGDYTIACNIEVHKEVVIWNRFKNFSTLFNTGQWNYSLAFCFDRKQYTDALEEALFTQHIHAT